MKMLTAMTFLSVASALRMNRRSIGGGAVVLQQRQLSMKERCEQMPPVESFWANSKKAFGKTFGDTAFPMTSSTIKNAFHQGFQNNHYRLQKMASKLLEGKGITIFVTGGSHTAGQGCPENKWSEVLQSQLHEILPEASWGKIKIINGAKGGATSEWFVNHISTFNQSLSEVDLFINEWNYNDNYIRTSSGANQDIGNAAKRVIENSSEEMYQRISSYPQKPAFIFFDTPPWNDESLKLLSTDGAHYKVAQQFSIPLLWYVDAVKDSGHLYLDTLGEHEHPSCVCHQVLASVISGMLHNEMEEVCAHGVQGQDNIPEAGFKKQKEFGDCVAKPTFAAFAESGDKSFKVIHNVGWAFEEDSIGKPGWIAKGPDAEIVFNIPIQKGDVTIEYLRSYEGVGTTKCTVEKAEDPSTPLAAIELQGKWDTHASIEQYGKIIVPTVSPSNYNLRCKTDGQKFKILALLTC